MRAMTSETLTQLMQQDHYRPDELAMLLDIPIDVIHRAAFAGELPATIVHHDIISISRPAAISWLISRHIDTDVPQTPLGAEDGGVDTTPLLDFDGRAHRGTDVLVPLDGSAQSLQALPWAQALLPAGSTIRLLTAVALFDAWWGHMPGVPSTDVIRSGMVRDAEERLRAVAESLQQSGFSAIAKTADGDAAEEILAAATDLDVEMIVMSSAGRGAAGRAQFGSVADRVARHATIPVLIAREREQPITAPVTVDRIIVPLDGSARAQRALPLACTLSKRLGAPIVLMTVGDPTGLALGYGTVTSMAYYELLRDAFERELHDCVTQPQRALERAGFAVSSIIKIGNASSAIAEEAHVSDLIVMTSHGRSGVKRWLLGSVAERLIRTAPSPVMLVPTRDA
jgi:nucleotide-binding universal stress UspA family protein